MGDMADDMNALKAFKKEQREGRAAVNIDKLRELGIDAVEQSKNVFRVETNMGAVMYYPPSGKWQHRGRIERGTPEQFQKWLKQRGLVR